ncbi:hypothetical protein [Rhizobium grahamii]|uniref:Uncharacterized protein n=1 Tax=Rhizobium grahamii CCGE 502 TaxID=990285 RepID=S3IL41_9HYPH|nr:hypothetical protein [Rhizobium grahamii]EPE99508.1 hypothetical protein RGCCGE502_04975 [Rhizobium grahamii CCGE 502]
MQRIAQLTASDKLDRETMFRLWQERGAMTEAQLIAAGISKESQARNAASVAERVRHAGMPIAA